tara:strand:- start:671 stop:931 length:261 start_codon:yes stop_codon:yes gene_type:complete
MGGSSSNQRTAQAMKRSAGALNAKPTHGGSEMKNKTKVPRKYLPVMRRIIEYKQGELTDEEWDQITDRVNKEIESGKIQGWGSGKR